MLRLGNDNVEKGSGKVVRFPIRASGMTMLRLGNDSVEKGSGKVVRFPIRASGMTGFIGFGNDTVFWCRNDWAFWASGMTLSSLSSPTWIGDLNRKGL